MILYLLSMCNEITRENTIIKEGVCTIRDKLSKTKRDLFLKARLFDNFDAFMIYLDKGRLTST